MARKGHLAVELPEPCLHYRPVSFLNVTANKICLVSNVSPNDSIKNQLTQANRYTDTYHQ
jgi:hypothetical protein